MTSVVFSVDDNVNDLCTIINQSISQFID